MAGWGSNNKYALLGGMRSAAQLVSYEIPGVLAALVPVMLAGTMSLSGIVEAQEMPTRFGGIPNWWFIFTPWGFLAFIVFLISGIAETNRTPFDLIEAESELAAGFHTEYSGMRFALFFLAEYANVFAVSAIGATLFLGGWAGPIPFVPSAGPGILYFLGKTFFLVFVFMWIRSTLPRLRYDQLMNFAWKRLLPTGPGGRRDHRRVDHLFQGHSWGREVGHARIWHRPGDDDHPLALLLREDRSPSSIPRSGSSFRPGREAGRA